MNFSPKRILQPVILHHCFSSFITFSCSQKHVPTTENLKTKDFYLQIVMNLVPLEDFVYFIKLELSYPTLKFSLPQVLPVLSNQTYLTPRLNFPWPRFCLFYQSGPISPLPKIFHAPNFAYYINSPYSKFYIFYQIRLFLPHP